VNEQLIFPMPEFEPLIAPEPDAPAELEVARFGDGDLRVRVHGSVHDRRCAVVGSVTSPRDGFLALMLAAETLKAQGAERVTVVIPYLAYARSDVRDPGGVQAIGVIGRALQGAGVDEVVTVDAHSKRAALLFPIPLVSLSPAGPLAEAIAKDFDVDQVVTADQGAFDRATGMAAALGLADPLFAGEAERGVCTVVVDDIVDSGRTLLDCCTTIAERGVENIVIAVTHPLFRGPETQELLKLPLRAIFTTDTILEVRRERPYLTRVVSVGPLIRAALLDADVASAVD
jgi:ribose-phosphate pyrophosphokinase